MTAVFAISSGDTIFIENGDYYLTNTLNLYGGAENIALIGESRDGVRLFGQGMSNASYGDVPHIIMVSDIRYSYFANMTLLDVYYHPITVQSHLGAWAPVFENLKIIDAGEQFIKVNSATPPTTYCDSGVVRNCHFEFTDRARSWYTNGVDILATSGWLIEDNTFLRIRGPVGVLCGPTILAWQNSINTTVRRNTFIECDIAISMGNPGGPGSGARDGETVYDNQNSIVINNIIYREEAGDVGITLNRARNAFVAHNTVILNGTFPWNIEHRYSTSTGRIENNLCDGSVLQRNDGGCTSASNIDFALESWFVDASGYNLHILPTSEARDYCPALPDVTRDFDDDPRPLGTSSDAGADEYNAGSQITEIKTSDLHLNIKPNPFNSNFQVISDYATNLTILDVQGKVVLTSNELTNTHTVKMPQHLSSGVYLLHLMNPNSKTSMSKKINYIK